MYCDIRKLLDDKGELANANQGRPLRLRTVPWSQGLEGRPYPWKVLQFA